MKHSTAACLLLVLVAGLLAGCDAAALSTDPLAAATLVPTLAPIVTPSADINLTSTAFANEAYIPALYTCDGEDVSPPLAWSTPPPGTQSLALIMDDPDAPGGIWVHWVVYNLPPTATGLEERASQANGTAFLLPPGAVQGATSFRRADYGGPCPPSGMHRYFFHLYALDTLIQGEALDAAGLLQAMQGHILAQGELMGVYER